MSLKSYFETAVPLALADRWISTGIHSLDFLLGRGLPRGSMLQIYGPSQSRKTTLVCLLMAAAQRQGLAIALWDTEAGFLEHVALLAGLKMDAPEFSLPRNNWGILGPKKQQMLTPGFLMDYEEDVMEKVFSQIRRYIRICKSSGFVPFMVVDSASRLSTNEEKFKGEQGNTMMTQSRIIRKCLRICMQDIKKSGGILVLIDHEKPTGIGFGSATGFFATNRLRAEFQHDILDAEENSIGVVTNLEATKSRYCAAGIKFPFSFTYTEGIDISNDVLWVGQMIGLIKQGGAWFTLVGIPHPDKKKAKEGKDLNFNGIAKWHDVFEEYKDLILNEWLPKGLDDYYMKKWKDNVIKGGQDPDKILAKFKDSVVDIESTSFDMEEDVTIK